jgi:Lon protease-like protein
MTPSLEAALAELPIFPLPRLVFFPSTILPLHIFEPRYRTMIADCLRTHGALAVVRIREGEEPDAYGNPRVESISGAGVITEHETLPDGRSNLLLTGRARVHLEELPFVGPYRRARATILEPVHTPIPENDRTALVAAATAFAREVKKRDGSFHFDLPLKAGASCLADVCAAHLVIDADARQAALEELDEAKRVRLVTRELALQENAFSSRDKRVLN